MTQQEYGQLRKWWDKLPTVEKVKILREVKIPDIFADSTWMTLVAAEQELIAQHPTAIKVLGGDDDSKITTSATQSTLGKWLGRLFHV